MSVQISIVPALSTVLPVASLIAPPVTTLVIPSSTLQVALSSASPAVLPIACLLDLFAISLVILPSAQIVASLVKVQYQPLQTLIVIP